MLNIKYLDKIRNTDVYKLTNKTPISLQIVKSRWKFVGHILRVNDNTQAKSMKHFSYSESQQFRREDGSKADLAAVTAVAEDSKKW